MVSTIVGISVATLLTAVIIFEVVKVMLYKTYTVTDVFASLLLTSLGITLIALEQAFPDWKIYINILSVMVSLLCLLVLGLSIFYFVALTKKHFSYNNKI